MSDKGSHAETAISGGMPGVAAASAVDGGSRPGAHGATGLDFRLSSAARIGLIVLLALIPAFIGSEYALWRVRAMLEHDSVIIAEAGLDSALGQERQLSNTVSATAAAISVGAAQAVTSPAACDALIKQWSSTPAGPPDILILDAGNIVRCATRTGLTGTRHVLPPEAQRAASEQHLVLGQLNESPFSQGASLPAAIPWQGPDGETGMVLLSFRPDLASVFGGITAPEQQLIVADRAGQVLYASPSALKTAPALLNANVESLLQHGTKSIRVVPWLDGREQMTAFAAPSRSAVPGVSAIVGVRESPRFKELSQLSRTLLLGLLVEAALITALVMVAMHFYVSRPIRRLIAAVAEWRAGRQAESISLAGSGEIAALGGVFSEMVEALELGAKKTQESAWLLHALIESSADAIFVKDLDGRLVLVNSTFARLFERSREELVGATGADLMAAETEAVLRASEEALLRSGKIQVCDLVFHPGPGETVFQTIYAPIMSPEGSIAALAAIARDMTQERAAAEMLRQAKAHAETADESKTRFLASASHDLRQPVQAAMLYAEMLGSELTGKLAVQANELHRVLGNMKVMLDLLLDVSRLDTKSVEPVLSDFNLQALVAETLAASQADAAAKGLRLSTEPTDAWVRSDRSMLARILNNLVSNAVRYTKTGAVTIGFREAPGHIAIEVRDTGIGIPTEDLARIWQEFEQLGNPARDSSAGLGLGLSIVQRLARLLNHPVTVDSKPGNGSCFRIVVPAARPSDADVESQLPSEPAVESITPGLVVLAEDNAMLLELFTIILEQENWTVLGGADHRDILPEMDAEARTPTIIISDYRLKDGLTGADTISAIREACGRRIPAIILTGEVLAGGPDDGGPVADAQKLGACRLLHKPIETDELLAEISRALNAPEDKPSLRHSMSAHT